MPVRSPPATTNSSQPATRRSRRPGGATAGAYQPWYLRVRAPAAVPHANPPSPSVSSHSTERARAARSAPEYASGLRTSFSGVVVCSSIASLAVSSRPAPIIPQLRSAGDCGAGSLARRREARYPGRPFEHRTRNDRRALRGHDPHARDRRRAEGELGSPGTAARRRAHGVRPVVATPEAQPARSRVARSGPLRPLGRARLHALVLPPPPDRLRRHDGRPEVLPPVGEPHARRSEERRVGKEW